MSISISITNIVEINMRIRINVYPGAILAGGMFGFITGYAALKIISVVKDFNGAPPEALADALAKCVLVGSISGNVIGGALDYYHHVE